MNFKVKVPWWAEDEQDPDKIVFLAFLYQVGRIYGYNNLYSFHNSDLRTILGIESVRDFQSYLKRVPWISNLLLGNTATDKTAIRILNIKSRRRPDINTYTVKELTEFRHISMWCYLLGAFNNNLIEEKDHTQRIGLDRYYKAVYGGNDTEFEF